VRLPPTGGDYAESFEDFSANSIHDLFRLMLQTVIVFTYDGQMPTVKVCFFTPSLSVLSSHTSFDLDLFMECKIDPKLPYADLAAMIHHQWQAK
jgi:hypothetical protein